MKRPMNKFAKLNAVNAKLAEIRNNNADDRWVDISLDILTLNDAVDAAENKTADIRFALAHAFDDFADDSDKSADDRKNILRRHLDADTVNDARAAAESLLAAAKRILKNLDDLSADTVEFNAAATQI